MKCVVSHEYTIYRERGLDETRPIQLAHLTCIEVLVHEMCSLTRVHDQNKNRKARDLHVRMQ